MRPVLLKMQAFGPFPKEVVLDFSDLQQEQMFLITGPTGSGKTTILDAMVYALYGSTSGLREGFTMRSDYADLETLTTVEFTFAIGDEVYKIERSPKQITKKRRGEGTREIPAIANLWEEKDGEFKLISSKGNQIKEYVENLLGFQVNQFLQVVLLPQGEFRKLLVASTSEREELFHHLFKTDVYRLFQDKLKEKYDLAYRAVKDTLIKRNALLETKGFSDQQALLEHMDELMNKLVKQSEADEIAKADYEGIAKHYQQYMTYQKELAQWNQYRDEQEKLSTRKSYFQSLANRQEQYQPLMQLIEVKQRLQKQRDKLQAQQQQLKMHQACEAAIVQKEQQLQAKGSELETAMAHIQSTKAEFYRMGHQVEAVNTWSTRRDALEGTKKSLVQEVSQLEELSDSIDTVSQSLAAIKEQEESYRVTLEAKNKQDALYRESEELLQRVRQIHTTHEQLQMQEAALKSARDEYEKSLTKRDERKALVAYWERILAHHKAYDLAQHIQPDQPCPVCGSVTHPHLAEPPTDMADERALALSREDYERALQEASRLTSEVAHIEGELTKTVAMYEQFAPTEEEIKVEYLVQAEKIVAHLKQEDVRLSQKLEGYRKHIQHKEPLVEQLSLWQGEYEQLSKIYENHVWQMEAETQYVEQFWHNLGYADASVFHRRYQELQDMRVQVESLQAAYDSEVAEVSRDRQAYEVQLASLISSLQASEEQVTTLEAEETALAQQMPRIDDLAALAENLEGELAELKAYESEVLKVDTLLQASQQRLSEFSEIPAMITEEQVGNLQRIYEEIHEQVVTTQHEVKDLKELFTKIQSLESDNQELEAHYQFVYGLYDVVSGGRKGMAGVTFERYVLGAILDDVLYLANERLRKMSRGRYELERTSTDQVTRGLRGLDLSVFDSYTGVTRPAKTLSGGEIFLASLALALGMADMIQSLAGGIHLETLFVDEGFGTLDSETLDIAMDTLVSMQEGGRLIGLISHVNELKTRIPAHLEVKRTKQGSQAYFATV